MHNCQKKSYSVCSWEEVKICYVIGKMSTVPSQYKMYVWCGIPSEK